METLFDIDTVRPSEAVRDANEQRRTTKHTEACFVCNKGMTDAVLDNGWWVHVSGGASLVPIGSDVDEVADMGYFPVGSECAKKIPAEYRTKL